MPEFAQIKAEPAFEQNERHPNADHWVKQVAKGCFRVDQSGDWPCDKARCEHKHNRRPTRAPSGPLRADAKSTDSSDCNGLAFKGNGRLPF